MMNNIGAQTNIQKMLEYLKTLPQEPLKIITFGNNIIILDCVLQSFFFLNKEIYSTY